MAQNLGDLLRELKRYRKCNYLTTDEEINNALHRSSALKREMNLCIEFELSMGASHPLGSNKHKRRVAVIEAMLNRKKVGQYFIASREDVELMRDLEGRKPTQWTEEERLKFASWGAELIDIEKED